MITLSIDWDYFIDATAYEREIMFPDGGNENLLICLQNYVWMSRYAECRIKFELTGEKVIEDIGIKRGELDSLYTLIKTYKKKDTKMYVYESHKEIANKRFTGKSSKSSKNFERSAADIINIDFHHDCYNIGADEGRNISGNEEINCGNWGRLLKNSNRINKLYWVSGENGEGVIDGLIEKHYNNIGCLMGDGEVFKSGIDNIFICRSAVWSPPHLDNDFIAMALKIDGLCNGNIDGIYKLIKRWDDSTVATIKELAEKVRHIRKE